jgi:hypothetical protein
LEDWYIFISMEKKICTKCEEEKSLDEFQFKNKEKGTKKSQCKSCIKEYRLKYYSENREEAIEYSKISSKERRVRNGQYVWNYLLEHPCIDCGEEDPIVLEFDHRDGVEKVMSVSMTILNGWSINRIQSEINKCDVRCSNCHTRRTAKQQGWYKRIVT